MIVPAAVGVPAIEEPVRFRPEAGKPATTDHVYGAIPPAAVKGCEYGLPTTAFGNEPVVIDNVALIVMLRAF